MSTIVDGRRRTWLAVLVVLAMVVLVGIVRALGSPSTSTSKTPSAALRTQLIAEVTPILEQETPAEHHDHGHDVGPGASGTATVLCAVDPFGIDPPDATALAKVRSVYAYELCAVAVPGAPWESATRFSGPVAVRFGDPPVLLVPRQGTGYQDRVREIIPGQYLEHAFGGFKDAQAVAELHRRFDAALRQD
jgi:hypothetical protein